MAERCVVWYHQIWPEGQGLISEEVLLRLELADGRRTPPFAMNPDDLDFNARCVTDALFALVDAVDAAPQKLTNAIIKRIAAGDKRVPVRLTHMADIFGLRDTGLIESKAREIAQANNWVYLELMGSTVVFGPRPSSQPMSA